MVFDQTELSSQGGLFVGGQCNSPAYIVCLSGARSHGKTSTYFCIRGVCDADGRRFELAFRISMAQSNLDFADTATIIL